MQSLADAPMMWQCKACATLSFNHHEHCDKCGCAKPQPAPEKPPSQFPRSEAAIDYIALDATYCYICKYS